MVEQRRGMLVCFLVALCLSSTTTVFIASKQSSFGYTYTTFTTRSAVECCSRCDHDDVCLSVNYNPTDRICELNSKNPADFSYTTITATIYTDLYYVGIEPCPQSWILYDRYCYYVTTNGRSWTESDNNCQAMGAHLTDIIDAQENAFIREIVSNTEGWTSFKFWIGIGTLHIVSPPVWVNGRSVNYTNYDAPPNNSNGNENCVEMDQTEGLWNDIRCTVSATSVCKKKHY